MSSSRRRTKAGSGGRTSYPRRANSMSASRSGSSPAARRSSSSGGAPPTRAFQKRLGRSRSARPVKPLALHTARLLARTGVAQERPELAPKPPVGRTDRAVASPQDLRDFLVGQLLLEQVEQLALIWLEAG